ncbi:MAG: hypothetical protein JOZ19_09640 [Rubrobacter sp.]|nr:hypothetical protein [Rubrobacter sp.]
MEATDGPNMFSFTGLMRFLLKNDGDPQDAPWDPYAYLGAYPVRRGPAHAGDIVVGQGDVGMATGDGNVLMSNAATGSVGYYPMSVMEPIVDIVDPWEGGGNPTTNNDTGSNYATPTNNSGVPTNTTATNPSTDLASSTIHPID